MIVGFEDLFRTILISAMLALALSPILIRVSAWLGLIDRPGSARHKVHSTATPTAGGLVFMFSFGICLLLLHTPLIARDKGILFGIYGAGVLGLLDDRMDLRPLVKLIGQVAVVSVLILLGIKVQITRIVWIDLLLTFLWLVGIVNAFNFIDSMDGLASGLAGVAAAFFMLVTVDSMQPSLAVLSAAILGSMIGSFIFSAPPAKMFLGDGGAQALGMAAAVIGIEYTPGQAGLPQGLTWFIPILALGVPIFDMVLVVISRLRRREPVYRAGTDHVYHRLVALGVESTRAVAMMQVAAILLSLAAFIALGTTVLLANLLFGAVCVLGLAALIVLERRFGRALFGAAPAKDGRGES
jgi:UDP-GlcNAc:undecaprenyl-phosphate GlcNAc-1-phosphate transferase